MNGRIEKNFKLIRKVNMVDRRGGEISDASQKRAQVHVDTTEAAISG